MIKIHHLNCGSMCPAGGSLVRIVFPKTIVCHCLLLETAGGLVLVDAGFSRADLASPLQRLGGSSLSLRPVRDPSLTAFRQIQALGFQPQDVTHVIPTHLDLDHAGGIVDFPDAEIHALAAERAAALRPRGPFEAIRYRRSHFAHGPRWRVHEEPRGELWHGFQAVRRIPGLPPEILLVPIPGHTRGHLGVAVRIASGWLLHAGDAYYDRKELAVADGGAPLSLRLFQSLLHHDRRTVLANQVRLRELAAGHPEITLFCAHDPVEFTSARHRSLPAAGGRL